MNSYYNTIMELGGAEDFKRLVKKWNTLSENIALRPTNAPVLLPDIFLTARSGSGKTRLLRFLSEYLACQGNLLDFYGDVKFFEFLLCYCSPSEPFTELNRLMDEVSNAAGFRSEYKGIVCVNIDEWVGHCEEKHFISFMEYLSANSAQWLIILSVSGSPEDKVKFMETFISMYLRLERVSLPFPETEQFLENIEKYLSQYGLMLDESAKRVVCATVDRLRKSKYFDGYKSVTLLCQDIAYAFFSGDVRNRTTLSEADVAYFAPDSDYVKTREYNIEKVGKIGLLNKA